MAEYMTGWRTLDTDCGAFLTDACLTAVRLWQLVNDGSLQRIQGAGPPAAGEPPVSGVIDALNRYGTGFDKLVAANSSGDRGEVTAAFALLEAATNDLGIAAGDTERDLSRFDPPIAPAPLPSAPGAGPAAGAAFTHVAEETYRALTPAVATITQECVAMLSDACAAAIGPWETAGAAALARLKTAPGADSRDAAKVDFALGVVELQRSAAALRTQNRTGGAYYGFLGYALIRDGAWRIHEAVTRLRG